MTSFDICKQNWRKLLVGSPEELKNGDETLRDRIVSCEKKAMESWNLYKKYGKDPSITALFRPTPAETSWNMTEEYTQLCNMALGYGTYGTKCYNDPEMLADILAALEWGYDYYYGQAVIEGHGWRDMKQFNWWDWCIGTPTQLMNAMLIVDEHLTLEQKRNYLALFNLRVPVPRDYGANKVNFGRLIAQAGVLTEREDLIYNGRDNIEDT